MIEPTTGKLQAGRNVFGFEIRQFLKDLLLREVGSEQIQYIDDADAHPTNAGASATLLRVDRDTFNELSHGEGFHIMMVRDVS